MERFVDTFKSFNMILFVIISYIHTKSIYYIIYDMYIFLHVHTKKTFPSKQCCFPVVNTSTLRKNFYERRPFAAWWPMRSAPEALEGDLEVLVEVLPGPKGPAPTGPDRGDRSQG